MPDIETKKCSNPGRACDASPPGQGSEEILNPQGKAIDKKVRTQTVLNSS